MNIKIIKETGVKGISYAPGSILVGINPKDAKFLINSKKAIKADEDAKEKHVKPKALKPVIASGDCSDCQKKVDDLTKELTESKDLIQELKERLKASEQEVESLKALK